MSSRIMLREMRELYVVAAASGPDDAAAADIGACLPELKQTYGEFARRQRAMLDRGLEGEKRYWSQHLNEGDLEVLNLPVDRTRPAKLTYRGDHVDLRVPTGLASALARLAAEWECTLFHAFLAIWALLLGRHSGAEHVVVGTPSHGRSATTTTTDENNLCGFFVNVLPLNLRVPRGMSASSLVRNVRKVAIEALSNSRVPFQYVVENLLPKLVRDPSRNSVFQTLIMWEPVDGWHADATTNWTTNLSFEPILLQPVVSMATCDVTFTGRPTTSGHVEATIKFNADLFERTSIQRLADHFVVLASALVEDQHIADIWQLTMISDRERERLLTEFNTSRVDSRAQDTLIQDLVWDQGRRYPATAAVEWQRVQMTYSELEQRALTIAAALRTLGGVKAEMIVALLLRKSLGMATAIFGVLSSGGAFMPLDPRSPVERQRLMLEDARCKNLVTHEDTDTTELVSGIIDLTTTRLGSDGLPVGTTDAPPLPPEVVFIPRPSSSTDLCYVMYTSGSTGRPKGVMVEHRGVVNVLLSLRSFFRAPFPEALREEPDRLVVRAAVTAQYIFDGFLKVFLGTLVFLGGTCVLFPNGSSLFELRESDDIGLISEVPTILALAESLPSSIRALTVSGEILSRVAALNCLPRVILNVYGPTEVSIDSTLKVVSDADTKTLSSIGKPLANVLCYVVAPDTMELQPIGVFGELILGGIQVARGYLNRPELTSAKFVKNPWPETDASGRGVVYRTGDLVRWHPNGELEFACRIDNQVKLRGHRIELGEIEHVLREQVGVIEAVCVLRDDVGAEPQLVAYVNPAEVTKDALRSSLRQTLPAYLVPSIVVGIEVWPRTGSGKIDRKRLPVPATGRAPEHRPPSSPLELTVARVVAEAIGCRTLDDLDVETSLFEQGASSLSAVRIRFMLQKEFSGLEDLESTLVFDHESIRELAAVIEERIVVVPSTDADIVPEPVIAQVAKAAAAGDHHHHQGLVDALDHVSLASDGNVLSYNQLQWLTECASADVSMGVGIMPLAKWVRGTVSIVALRKALNDLVHRHAILRTTYGLDTDNHFTQTVHEHMEVNFVDAVAMTEADALQRARDEQSVPFDLLRGDPVVRCLCVCLLVEDSSSSSSSSSERTLRRDLLLLVVFVHHIACDGTSTRIVLRELRELYLSATCTTSAAAENGSCLPKPELQYFDFARTQRALLLSDDLLEKHKRYWSQHLREGALEPLNLPLDYPRSPRLTYSGDYVEVRVSTDLASALSALAAEFHCRLFHVFLAIWALLLGRHSGAEEVVVGTPSEGRTFPGFRRSYDNVCGYFVNVLPLNINVSRGLSAPQLVETCKRVVIDSLSSSHVPFQYVVNELLPKLTRDPTRNTVFQTLINWQPMDGWSSDSQTWTPALTLEKIQLPSPPPMATCDVMLTARPTAAGRVEAIIEFNAKLFERASIERLAERFLVLAAALVHDREIADIWQLPMIPDSERDRLLTEFNHQTCADHQVRDVLVNDLVWEQARRHPEITAVEWQGSQMTYSELEDAASTIGARLRALGVRSNVIVALLLHRSLAMATAILGVLSAGGAFMPLDTRAPAKRQRLTLEDARCSHLITREDADDSTELFSGIDLTELRLGSDGRVKSSGFLEVFTRSSADLCYIIYTSGGEALTRNVASNSRLNRRHLLNVYGPTEVSIISTVNIVTDADTKTLSSIGKPLANVACYVVAPDTMELQPIGVFGELILGGIQVARGYLNRPDLTSAKFVKNPWPETDPSGRGVVYRTGDLVRWRPNGELEFAGRIDNQVKLRGHRIELGEIEHVLREQVGVIEAVCVLRDDVSADPQLVAYVNPAAADLDVEASLRPCLQQTLPAYLVPSIIVGIEVWPRTGSGKIDRKRLPVPVARRATGERRPPASPIETTVARIVANTIGCSLDDVDAETSLFELGANSLSAVRIRFKLQEEFPGVELEPTLLLDHKNVRELAAVLETKGIITAPSRDMSNAPLDDGTNSLDVVTVAEGTETREQRVLHYYSALRFACWVVAYSYVAAVFVVPAWLVAWRLNQSQVESWRLAILVHGPLAWASLCVLLSFAAAGTRLLLAPGAAAVSLESVKFIAWWTIERIDQMNRFLFLEELRRTPLLALYYRLLGAHIGSGVVLDTVHVREPRFVFIGAGCVLGPQVIVHPRKFDMVRRQVVFQTVELGASCRIEARAVLASGTKLASRTTVGPLATVTRETGNCGTNDGSSVSPEEPTTVWSTTCLSFVTSLVAIYATIVIIIASTYPAFVTLSLVLKKEGLYPPSNHKNVADALHSNPEAFATFTSTFVAAFSSKKKNSEACSYIVSPIFPSMSMIFSNTDPKVQRKLFLQRYGKTARLVPLVACVLVQHELAALAFGVASFWIARGIKTCLTRSWTHVDFLLERITNLRQLRVGKNAHLGSFCTVFPTTGSTITIGDNSVVGFGSVILGTTDGSVHIPTTTLVGGNTLIRGGHAELREFSVAMNTEAMIAGAQEIEERTTEGYAIIARQGAVSFPWDRHGSRESLDYDHALTFWHKVLYVVAPFALLLWTRLLFGIALYGAVATATAAFEWLVYDVRNSDYGPDVHFRNSKPFLAVRAFAALAFLSSFLLGYACLAIVNKWFWFALDAQGRKTKQWMPFSVGYWMRQFGDAGRAGFTITSFFFVSSTAAYGWFVRMLGARVEGNAIVAAPVFWDVDNLVLKQNAVVEEGAIVFCHQYASDHVEVGTVTIGAGAVLEPGSLTTAGYELGAGSRLLPNKLGVPSKWAHESSIRGTHHHHHHHKRHY
ncbi:hypothetical protein CTAYLR_003483 [Chrysophaeum taylorii]|uniref:Carrier domain-containing protein n=1 Tax=Chrysophaeum taylorii TaxID=2483200 RepID=A0AAD7U8F0_9STRA|nr:hypothetical protein CTAYLR_003483 [Chrysophaeum taylorii]